MRMMSIIAILALALTPCNAQMEDIEIDIDGSMEEGPYDTSRVPHESSEDLFLWSWDIPEEYDREYPITHYNYWIQARAPLGGGVRGLHLRDKNNLDDFHFSGYFFFRPLVMNFKHSHVSLGAFISFDAYWGEETIAFDLLNPEINVRKRGFPIATGFSMMWSVPEYGIQMTLELGHVWIRSKYRLEDLTLALDPDGPGPVPPIVLPGTGEISRVQHERSINLYYNFSWVRGETFFNGFSLELTTTNRISPVEVDAKASHPLFPVFIGVESVELAKDSPVREPTHINYVLGLGFLKLLSIPVANVPSLGISKYHVIDMEPAFAVGHFTTDNGYILGAGCRIRVFGALGFNYLHVWEQRNDAYDSDIWAVELGFQLGRSAASRVN